MDVHKNARLTPRGRERILRLIEGWQSPETAARAAGVCLLTACNLDARFKAEGGKGLADCSSRPWRLDRPTSVTVIDHVIALPRQKLGGLSLGGDDVAVANEAPKRGSYASASLAISGYSLMSVSREWSAP
jgi:hypothetical protein